MEIWIERARQTRRPQEFQHLVVNLNRIFHYAPHNIRLSVHLAFRFREFPWPAFFMSFSLFLPFNSFTFFRVRASDKYTFFLASPGRTRDENIARGLSVFTLVFGYYVARRWRLTLQLIHWGAVVFSFSARRNVVFAFVNLATRDTFWLMVDEFPEKIMKVTAWINKKCKRICDYLSFQ